MCDLRTEPVYRNVWFDSRKAKSQTKREAFSTVCKLAATASQ